jgi:Iron-sulfur cluster assembly accessory protein
MLEITEKAAGAMQRAIDGSQGEAKGIRISLVPGSCAELKFKLELEPAAKDDDNIVKCGDVALFIDMETGKMIGGTRVDYVESLDGGAFVFQNPHAASTCVCGKSFTPASDA